MIKFPYIQFRGKLVPVVPIKFKAGEEWVELKAYVDSGASYSIFHSSIVEILNLELEKGRKAYVTVGDGSQIIVYLHKIIVRIAELEFDATIGFSRHLGIGFNIIGRLDIFDRFRVCFDESEKVVEFHPKSR